MTSRERFLRMYRHEEADRVPVLDSPWKETVDRWVREGMPDRDYIRYFDLDRTAYISTDNSPRLPVRVVREDERSVVSTTKWGAVTRTFRHATTTPENLSFTVTDALASASTPALLIVTYTWASSAPT